MLGMDMKAKPVFPMFLSLAVLLLVGCGDDRYVANDEHCKLNHIHTLPKGGKRDALFDACMKRLRH